MKAKILLVLSVIMICALLFAACDSEKKPPEATEAPTAKPTNTPTPVPTPTPTPKPTVAPISEEKKGVPQKDAVVLFEDKFDEDNLDDLYFRAQGENMVVEDGKLTIPTNWSSFMPDVNYNLGIDHSQYEMTLTYESIDGSDFNPWSSLFVGSRCPLDGNPKIATEDGMFWVAFNGSAKAHVYPGGGGTYNGTAWNLKYFEVELPEDFIGKPHKITVVDCGDVICYYMNTADQEYYLIVKVLFEGDELVCYGNDGSEIWRETNMLPAEGSFHFFNHYGRTIIDDIVIKGLA